MKEKKIKPLFFILPVIIIMMILSFGYCHNNSASANAVLTVKTPKKISVAENEPFILDVEISSLGEAIYPAMSASIAFDPSCLEFLGVEEGNVFVSDEANSYGRALPQWSCNVNRSNKTGIINIMYLDVTGSEHAFKKELLAEEDNIIFRLKFRLRGSVRAGDVYEIVVEDAVFAASDEKHSLSMKNETLKVKNSKIVTGE